MADPIITEADRDAALDLAGDTGLAPIIAAALAQARADGRLAGMEEAARICDRKQERRNEDDCDDSVDCVVAFKLARAIRARTTKEG